MFQSMQTILPIRSIHIRVLCCQDVANYDSHLIHSVQKLRLEISDDALAYDLEY